MKNPAPVAPATNASAAVSRYAHVAESLPLSITATATLDTSPVRWLTEVPRVMRKPAFTAALANARLQPPMTIQRRWMAGTGA